MKFVGVLTVGGIGTVISTTSPVVVPVLVFQAKSVIVIVVSTPSSPPVPTTHVQLIFPVTSAGFGVQVIHGILVVAHCSTPVSVVLTIVPLFAGFGVVEPTLGVLGGVLSITSVGAVDPVEVLPASSVIVIVLLVPSKSPHVAVAVQSTVPLPVTGEGIQFIQGTETVDPISAHVRESVTVSPLITGFGESIPTFGPLGASVSFIIDVLIAAEVFHTRSVAVVSNDTVPSGYPERSILVDHDDHVAVTVPSTTQLDVVIVIISPDPVHQPLKVTDDSSDSLKRSSHISGE